MTAAAAAVLALTMSTTAFAAWEQDASGNWRYMTGRDTWVTSGYTQDGYWVDVNGYWDGSPSIGIRQDDGSYKEYEDINQGQAILGRRIFKSEGQAEVDDRNTMFTVTCTVYDTSFKTEDEIKGITLSSIPIVYAPKLSPRSQFRSIFTILHASSPVPTVPVSLPVRYSSGSIILSGPLNPSDPRS